MLPAFALISLVSLSLADQNIGIFNSGLDPAPLKWWQTKWSNNPIDLSVTYKGATSRCKVETTNSLQFALDLCIPLSTYEANPLSLPLIHCYQQLNF